MRLTKKELRNKINELASELNRLRKMYKKGYIKEQTCCCPKCKSETPKGHLGGVYTLHSIKKGDKYRMFECHLCGWKGWHKNSDEFFHTNNYYLI